MLILGASSLHHAIESLPQKSRSKYKSLVFTLPGLSLNFNSRNLKNNVQYQLENEFSCANKVIIWHDVINNSTTSHPNNNYQPLSINEVQHVFLKYSKRISAVVYCPRENAPDVTPALLTSKIPTILILKHLISKRKQKDNLLHSKYLKLHQPRSLEPKSLTLTLVYANKLSLLFAKNRPRRLSKRRRRSLKNKSTVKPVAPRVVLLGDQVWLVGYRVRLLPLPL